MLMTVFKVLYVVIAIVMIAFILLQRGAGAQQGGGFGAGASATVFGASGSANFLSRSTKWLAALFFGLSIGMAAMISHGAKRDDAERASRMSGFATETPATGEVPAAPGTETPAGTVIEVPAVGGETPAAGTPPVGAEAPSPETAPAAPTTVTPAAESAPEAAPAEAADKEAEKGNN